MQHLLLLVQCSAFVPPARSNCIGRVALPHAVDASVLLAVDAVGVKRLTPRSAAPGLSRRHRGRRATVRHSRRGAGLWHCLILALAALARRPAPAAQVLEIVESIPAEQWQKLLLCIAFDAAGDLSESLPFHGLLELALGPLDYFVLRYLFEDSFAIPVAGLLEEWLPIPVEFLPTATLAWCVQNLAAESEIARKLGLVKKKK